MTFDPQKTLLAYAGVTTAALAWFLIAAAAPPAPTRFGTIDVDRINIREPDGTLRMTISDAARSPGIIVKGTEYPHPSRQAAGMLFYNDEGTENGGLIFGGQKTGGKAASYGSLTFDRYQQDQVVQLLGEQDGADRRAGLIVNEVWPARPAVPVGAGKAVRFRRDRPDCGDARNAARRGLCRGECRRDAPGVHRARP